MKVTVLYFAWLRERIGHGSEQVETSAMTASELVAELMAKGPEYAAAFADVSAIKVAIDQNLATFDTALGDAREVAFFPPMTGG